MPKNIYTITVGQTPRPLTVKRGIIERGTGQTVVTEKGESLAKRGDTGFPNGNKIWAARAIRDENGKLVIPKDVKGNFIKLTPTDPLYKGEILRLKWGQDGGSIMDVRYIKGYPSLDVLYQERILNFKVDESNENSAEVYMLTYPNGDNDIDENIDPLLAEHLKGHTYNRDSESKDPNFHTYMFWNKSFDQEERLDSKASDDRFEAGKLIRDLVSGDDEMARCKNVFSIIKSITDEEPEDKQIFAYLRMIAEKKAPQVIKAIDDYKLKVSNMFVKLESHEILDLTIPGTIGILKPKRQKIISDIPGKGKDMLDYFMENIAAKEVFEATFELLKITDKIN